MIEKKHISYNQNYIPLELKIGDLVYFPKQRRSDSLDYHSKRILRMPLVYSKNKRILTWIKDDKIPGGYAERYKEFPYDVCFLVVDLLKEHFIIMHNNQQHIIRYEIFNLGELIRKYV